MNLFRVGHIADDNSIVCLHSQPAILCWFSKRELLKVVIDEAELLW